MANQDETEQAGERMVDTSVRVLVSSATQVPAFVPFTPLPSRFAGRTVAIMAIAEPEPEGQPLLI